MDCVLTDGPATSDDCGDVCVPADYQGSGPLDVVYNMRAVLEGF